MKYYLTYIFLSLYLTGFSQDYFRYNKSVSSAESFVLKAEYKNALLVYDSLFSQYKFCFAHDCFVALQVATLTKDSSRIHDYIIKCFKSGIRMDYIEHDTITQELKKDKNWLKLNLIQDSLYLEYCNRLDKKLVSLTIELNAIDQHYRNNHEVLHWKHPIRKTLWNLRWLKEIQIIVDDKLYPVLLEKGYLGEKIIGIKESWMSYSFTSNSINNSIVRLMFMHYYSNKHRMNYSEFLWSEVGKGNLSAVDYAIIMDFRAKWSDKNAPFYNEWHTCPDKSAEMLQTIENRRKELGLPTLADNEKMYFQYMQIMKKKECPISYYIKLWNH